MLLAVVPALQLVFLREEKRGEPAIRPRAGRPPDEVL
jgi:hypothetical protein